MSFPSWTRAALRWIAVFVLLGLAACQARLSSPPAPSVTLALLGDVMMGRGVRPSSETFAYLRPYLASADLALANLESPLTNAAVQTESAYALCAAPEHAEHMADAGFDLLSLANNHSLDCGPEGLLETQSALRNAGLAFIGPGPEPVIRLTNGIRQAFLAFDATGEFDPDIASRAVHSAREAGAVVIVSIHWGAEYQSGASSGQEQIAGELAEAGAALIWGHHPHVLQHAEWVNDGRTLVLYSLGNALFDQHGLEATRRSALVLVRLDRDGVQDLEAIPFRIDVHNSQIVEASGDEREAIMQYFKE